MKLHELKIEKKHKGKCFKATKNYVVYKHIFGYPNNGIAILVIPKGTRIVCNFQHNKYRKLGNRKLRAEVAHCIGIIPFKYGTYQEFHPYDEFFSMKNIDFKYEIGTKLVPDNEFFCNDVYDFCRPGIHFFASLKDAERHTQL